MVNLTQGAEYIFYLLGREHKRVATGKEYIGYLRSVPDILDSLRDIKENFAVFILK